mmetsp:Transcript_43033/g.102167  ORF Transcript_43033/g.102167 Transcript_43033/m.102167 type:complete len:83 (+) Transcript_43033:135-383(+)
METVSQDLQQKERRDSDDLDLSTPVGRKRPVFSKESPYSLDDDELELHLETMFVDDSYTCFPYPFGSLSQSVVDVLNLPLFY